MKALVDAEVLKLRSTRMVAGLVLAALVLVVLTVVSSVPNVGADDPPVPLDDPTLLARVIGLGFCVPEVLMMLLGVLAVTQEFRYGTASSTFLVTPRRSRVLTAKWLGLALASVPIALATLLVAFTVTIPLIHARHGTAAAGAELWQVVATAFVALAVYGIIGVSIGALVRNQITAIAGVLVWMLTVEQILTGTYPAIGRWMLLGTTLGLLQLGPMGTTNGTLLPAPTAALVLAGYTALITTVAFVVTPRRDVV